MSKETKSSILIAVLGIVLGALITLSVRSIIDLKNRNLIRVNYAEWQKLGLILNEIENNYVDTIDVEKLTDVAVQSVLGALDPHSVYLPPVDLERANSELAGRFYGIGIMFQVPNDTAVVTDIIPGGPAEKVGLMKGDRILKVDGKVIAGVHCPQDSMVFRMKGELDTKVDVLILRDQEQIDYKITRGAIPMHSVDVSYMINDTTGYLKLSKFNATTIMEVMKATDGLLADGMKHLIFDLRDNSGGYFVQALFLANLFLEEGDEIVYLEGLHRKKETHRADGTGKLKNIGLSVLINENSASSSEIFAGAVQDNDRGVIIGRRSFGKGLVQESINYSDRSGMRLTVARFYTPSGRSIQKPYGDDYNYDIYKRYAKGEMFNRDSIKVDEHKVYKTVGGRIVHGGGGIIPDIFVPVDTTNVTPFSIECNKKGLAIRYAAIVFDQNKKLFNEIDTFNKLEAFLHRLDIPRDFLSFVRSQGVKVDMKQWNLSKEFMLPQLRAIIARYTKLGDVAFYSIFEEIDPVIQAALHSSDIVEFRQDVL